LNQRMAGRASMPQRMVKVFRAPAEELPKEAIPILPPFPQ